MIFRPGHNAWHIARAPRMSVLIDAAAYFEAVRSSLLKAQRRVFIVGWDIHSRMKLVGESGAADDGYPETLADFLSALVRERPKLEVSILVWDFAVLYAGEREFFPTYTLRWNTPSQIQFCLDDAIPLGSSQHQKLIVVDDAVAFCGGLDVTVRRWDTSQHDLENPKRIDPAGKPYNPFHDVQAVVDGPAAQSLARIVRARWECAVREKVPMLRKSEDVWPEGVAPDFKDVDVAISRTQPPFEDQKEVREVETLFLDMIAAAERTIYIENQFLSCTRVAEAIAQRMKEKPELEVLLVAPATHASWLEARSMRNGRIRFTRLLGGASAGERLRLLSPQVTQGAQSLDTMVHSKVMIVDDRLLRVGSANLNNRSMGTDTECDLSVEAKTAQERKAILAVRDRLLADHCGCKPEEVAAAIKEKGSLVVAAESLSARGHRLVPVNDGEPDSNDLSAYIEGVADPERPIGAEDFVSSMFGGLVRGRQTSTVVKLIAAGVIVVLLALLWSFSPLSSLADPKFVGKAMDDFARDEWGPLVVLLVFVGGGLVMFPVTILVAATAATFGPWLGFLYAMSGAVASALVTYTLGARLGKDTLRDVLGPRLNKIRRRIARKGVLAVATIRLVPLAPFTLVNLVAGASDISFSQFLLGTIIGLLPGVVVMSALGDRLAQLIAGPTPGAVAAVAGIVAIWIAASIGIQALVSKYGRDAA